MNRNVLIRRAYSIVGRVVYHGRAAVEPLKSGTYWLIGMPVNPAMAVSIAMMYPQTGV